MPESASIFFKFWLKIDSSTTKTLGRSAVGSSCRCLSTWAEVIIRVTWPLDFHDGFHSGSRDINHNCRQLSFPGLLSPRRSDYTVNWNRGFQSFIIWNTLPKNYLIPFWKKCTNAITLTSCTIRLKSSTTKSGARFSRWTTRKARSTLSPL